MQQGVNLVEKICYLHVQASWLQHTTAFRSLPVPLPTRPATPDGVLSSLSRRMKDSAPGVLVFGLCTNQGMKTTC